jgi:hypothetical protein
MPERVCPTDADVLAHFEWLRKPRKGPNGQEIEGLDITYQKPSIYLLTNDEWIIVSDNEVHESRFTEPGLVVSVMCHPCITYGPDKATCTSYIDKIFIWGKPAIPFSTGVSVIKMAIPEEIRLKMKRKHEVEEITAVEENVENYE